MSETQDDLENIIALSKDKETIGFDLNAGKTWIYPTNYPVRDYQHRITEAALLNNSLVSLPTGLGKTFIAAVVMYNYFRWYPTGKIIFMAPTKPLVAQQIDACYNITAIPKNATVEMTGAKASVSRIKLWKEKRVFFITPHILQNDIDTVVDLAPQIRCIVIDEAHRALGKNANCEAIKKIQKINSYFRILALSATPGSNYNSIKDVITNLLISHIEVRTNESPDVAPYVFQRKLDRIVIPIRGKLAEIKDHYIKVLDIYTRPLFSYNIIGGNCANLSKGRIVMIMKEFKEKRHHPQYGYVLKTLNICVTLYHGYELLVQHGLRTFLKFFREHLSKPLINSINELHNIIRDVENYVGPIVDIEMLPDGTIPQIEGEIKYSHPKFQKLAEVLTGHFNQVKETNTRAMIFCEYRESVMEIYDLLLRYSPLIKPKLFLGQAVISQAQQLQAVKMFKSGICNTLVSTCIGEEGLDVGEVDLIICFDISSKSPIRMVQRMGRTGRQRDGRVVVLITEGKEQQLFSQCLVQRNAMNSLLESQQIKSCLYQNNPKMVPSDFIPECNQMFITIQALPEIPAKKHEKKGGKKNNNVLKSMFEIISTTNSKTNDDKNAKCSPKKSVIPVKKQSDIRSMFSKLNSSQTMPNVSQALSQFSSEELTEDALQFKSLITEIKSLNLRTQFNVGCEFCDNLFNCKSISCVSEEELPVWKKPDDSLLNKINLDMLTKYAQSQNNATEDMESSLTFFKLNSTFDIFDESDAEFWGENPAVFNQSLGVFNSSYQQTQNQFQTPTKNNVSEDIVISDSDTSPVFSRTGKIANLKHNSQRQLFSQTNKSCISDSPSKLFKFSSLRKNKILPKQIKNKKNPILDLMAKSSTSKSTSTPKKGLKNTLIEQLANSTPICTEKMNNESNASPVIDQNFWDESLFEICDSDEVSDEREKQKTSNICDNNKYVDKGKESSDSDATIILSFNSDVAEVLPKEKEFTSNTTNNSLLTVTQVIEFLNDTKTKNESKSSENLNSIVNDTTSGNKINLEVENGSKKPEIDSLLEDFNPSDDEFSLLSFSQKARKKKQLQKPLPDKKFDADVVFISDDNNDLNLRGSLKENENINTNIQNTFTNILNAPKDHNYGEEEISLLNCSQKAKKVRNKKMKLQLSCTKTAQPEASSQDDSPVKDVKRNCGVKRPSKIVDSDDDFEERPRRKLSPETKRVKSASANSRAKLSLNYSKNTSALVPVTALRKQKNPAQKKKLQFIDDEAAVSGDEFYEPDSEEENDILESSFIHDTQSVVDTTDMHAKYLESIRSPKKNSGFKMPMKPPPKVYENIYSQEVNTLDDTYVTDSFCIDDDATLTQRHGLSYLEVLEAELEKRVRRDKKRKRIAENTDEDSD